MERERHRAKLFGVGEVADGHQCFSRILTHPIGVRVFGSKRALGKAEGAFEQRPGAFEITLVLQQRSEIAQTDRDRHMIGAERLFVDRHRALIVSARVRQLALVVEE